MRLPGAVASAGGGPASDGGQASLVSWNLLAPEYADPAKYPWTSAAHLSWEARAPRIVERIGELDADAVALQEVPLARWDALYAELQPLGYDAELQTLSRGSARTQRSRSLLSSTAFATGWPRRADPRLSVCLSLIHI